MSGDGISRKKLEQFARSREWYQSYEFLEPFGIKATSDSSAKFDALRLPDLLGKTVLDLGCDTGFLSFRALEEGAALVVGVDGDFGAIETACAIRDHIRCRRSAIFVHDDITHFLSILRSSFDVVIAASVAHYLDLPSLLRRLAAMSVQLVALELPYVPGSKDLHVSRGGLIVVPGEKALASIAKGQGFTCKKVGPSEKLDADERAVFHFEPVAPPIKRAGKPRKSR